MGTPTTFVRFVGCNLDCSWCDTKYAREGGNEMSIDQIFDQVEEVGTPFVCLTGGEPLLQEDIYKLIETLLDNSLLRHHRDQWLDPPGPYPELGGHADIHGRQVPQLGHERPDRV